MDEVLKGLGLIFMLLWVYGAIVLFCSDGDFVQLKKSCIRLHYAEYDKEGNFVLVEKK